jgi:hypothetical protein
LTALPPVELAAVVFPIVKLVVDGTKITGRAFDVLNAEFVTPAIVTYCPTDNPCTFEDVKVAAYPLPTTDTRGITGDVKFTVW